MTNAAAPLFTTVILLAGCGGAVPAGDPSALGPVQKGVGPRPAHDGRTAVRVLIPPPRIHRHPYHGVFAPNAKWPREVTGYGRTDVDELDPGSEPGRLSPSESAPPAPEAWIA